MIKEDNSNKLNYFIYLFIFVSTSIGLLIYKDYGVSADELGTRFHGIISLNYIFETFLPLKTYSLKISNEIPDLKNYAFKEYGVLYELILILIENFLNLNDTSEILYFRHIINYLFFISSVVCFYYLVKNHYNNLFYGIIGALILYTSPRIFADSFYNNKDLIFLSFFIFSLYFAEKFMNNVNYINALLFSLSSAFLIDIRIIGIYVPFLVLFFLLIDQLMLDKFRLKKIYSIVIFIFFTITFVIIFWPFLWESPIKNIFYAMKSFSDYAWDANILYMGKYIHASNLPWHYIFVWIFATTSIGVSFFLIIGVFAILKRFIKRFVNIDKNDSLKDLWRGSKEKFSLFVLLTLLAPIILIISFKSTIYGGWRHLYFIYPLIIFIFVYGIRLCVIIFKKKIKNINLYLNIIIFLIIVFNTINLVKLHPYQNIYFNFLFEKKANALFEIDYWGLGNREALEKILDEKLIKDKITIGVASFTPLEYSQKMLSKNKSRKIDIIGTNYNNPDFIFNNFIYEVNPLYSKKYKIPNNYEKSFVIKRGNIIINEVFKIKN